MRSSRGPPVVATGRRIGTATAAPKAATPTTIADRWRARPDGEARPPGRRRRKHEEGRDEERVGEHVVEVGHRRERRLALRRAGTGRGSAGRRTSRGGPARAAPRRAARGCPPPAGRGRRRPTARPDQQVDELGRGRRDEEAVRGEQVRDRAGSRARAPSPGRRHRRHQDRPRAKTLATSSLIVPAPAPRRAAAHVGDDRRRLLPAEEDVEAARQLAEQGLELLGTRWSRRAMPSFWQ